MNWESKTLSRNSQIMLIIAVTAIIAILFFMAIYWGGIYVVISLVVGLPLALMLMSLVFGSLARDKGLFSWPLLYFISALTFLFLVFDNKPSGHAYWFPSAIFALAEQRRRAARKSQL